MSEQPNTPRMNMIQQAGNFMEDEIDLMEYYSALVEGKKLLFAVAGVIALIGALYAFLATPIYQADVLIQIDQKKSGGPLGELSDLVSGETPTEAEIEIIKSRSILGEVVSRLGLDIEARPHYFPLVGRRIADLHSDAAPADPWLGAGSYAWGGEVISLSSLNVPEDMIGKSLTLLAQKDQHFDLLDSEGNKLLSGVVGQPARQGDYSLFVSKLQARPGTRFDVAKFSWAAQIAGLATALSVSEKGKKTGILQLLFESSNPARATLIANTISNVYLAHNVERKSEEAKQALGFIEHQLPEIRAQLTASETSLNEFRGKQASVDLSAEAQAVIQQMANFERQKLELDIQRQEMARRYTDKHPLMQAFEAKAARINAEKARLESMIRGMPSTDQEIVTLARDAKVNQEIYTFLLNKSQELKVAKAGTVGDVYIVDAAITPDVPIKPKRTMILALSILLGLFAGAVVVLVRKALHKGIEDPAVLEEKLGLSVYAGVPYSAKQAEIYNSMHSKKGGTIAESLLALADPSDMAVESLRSLRTNLHFGLLEAKNNIVMMTGPAPEIGKSFVSVNFSQVMGDVDKKVLLIDADMRKGHLHEYLGGAREPGLSDVISGEKTWQSVIQRKEGGKFDLLSTGHMPPNPSELLMHPNFMKLLHEVSAAYDLVMIDTPPVLAATDAVIIGKHAGTVFLLTRAGRHPLREIQQALRALENGGIKVNGAIFNGIKPRQGYGYGNYHYQYAYKRTKQ